MSPSRPRWGPFRSLLALSPALLGAPLIALKQHYLLPEPLTAITNPVTLLPQISESRILGYAKHLSEEIGYRTVGTLEHALADAWMVEQAEIVKKDCERVVEQSGRKLECEVWRQQGSGSHRFDMMNKRLYKTYVNLTNIIVRISDGTAGGKENAVLVNAHLDSTLPSPGASDDALSVGVMLECMRVLVNTPDWTPKHAIIFLFNHAEESLQDGSHLYSTQHPTATTVRAMINLEAAGSTGRELLFQATSEQMIEAYSHVPRPFGTIFANDIFSSGVILSDTDFRQFEQYLNVTGLDMAVVGNSYIYHMRKDLVENIQPGVAQNMAENVLALLQYLSSPASPLPSLTSGYTRPTTVYFSLLGHFFVYSFTTAKVLYGLLVFSSAIFVKFTFIEPAPALKKGKGVWREQARGTIAVFAGAAASVVAPNIVAVVMDRVLGKGMSWFSSQYSAILLYGPPALFGALASQLLLGPIREQTILASLLLIQSVVAFGIQALNVGSAAIFYVSALPLFFSLVLNEFIAHEGEVSLWTYGLGQVMPLLGGTLLVTQVIEVFVPLTGRIGADAPADNIVATIVSAVGAQSLPLLLPLAHRFGHRALLRGTVLVGALSLASIAAFSLRVPFDEMHQKRLFVLHLENITTGEHHLHVAAADGAPGFYSLVRDIAEEFVGEAGGLVPVFVNDHNAEWDPLYPFSSFLSPYKVELAVDAGYASPWKSGERFRVSATADVVDAVSGTRALTLSIYHPGIIWSVIAFDAHVLRWNLDDNPPAEHVRHHIKEASFYGTDVWTLDLILKIPSGGDGGKLKVNFIGLQETGMWPAKRGAKGEEGGRLAMGLFEELDGWLERKTGGTVDAMLLGCVGGVVVV